MKGHHVVSDGIGAVQLAAHLFDFEAPPDGVRHHGVAIIDGRPVDTEPPQERRDEAADVEPDHVAHPDPDLAVALGESDGDHGGWEMFHRWRLAAERDVAVVASVARTQLHDAVPNLLRLLRDPVGTVAEVAETARSVGRVVAPVFDTKSPVMTKRTLTASFHTFELPLEPLRVASRRAGGTLNDGFLAGITGGLRRYHELHGARVEELRMAMPMSLRTDEHDVGGNHITVLRFTVPIEIPDPVERIRALHELGQRLKSERSLAHTEAIAGALNMLPSTLLGTMLKHVDFLASNVPGMPVPMYLAGVEVERFFPFGPTAGSSVNLTLMSYCDVCCIGVNRDTGAIPDGDLFLRCLAEGFDEVLALADR
jgi:WS/DGAT/MGAT family acyltransferase